MTSGIGDKINLVGFFFFVVGSLAAFIGGILMFLGSSLAGESVWQNLKKIQGVAESASVVSADQWTPIVRFDLQGSIPMSAKTVKFSYYMQSSDTRIPLKMTISPSESGLGKGLASGGQGVIEIKMINPELFVSVSHPTIQWSLVPTGYSF
ncbi:hypothetical protein [Pseudomonas koreensis]|uniref:hypothetical protein n=1 Tax=Pseudomonas koreensis TaxID=198620 RepID=UPI0014728A31|nr:hypothetical protein [Pseudomonas koreensis]NNA56349.1 hypothetical protein [Pseudomonas koreensis]